MAKGKGSAKAAASGDRRFPYGRVALGLLILAVALGPLFYFYSPAREGASTAFETFIEWFGIGLLIAGLLVLSWAVWRHRGTPSLRKWRIGVGVLILILVVFGILSSFKPASGSFGDYGYGGVIGQAMIGWPTTTAGYVAGAFRLAAMVILACFLISPQPSWNAARRTASAIAEFYRRHPLHRYLWMSLCGWGYLLRSVYRAIRNRRRRVRTTVVTVAQPKRETPPPVVKPVEVEKVKAAPTAVKDDVEDVAAEETVRVTELAGGQWQLPSIGLLERSPEVEPATVDTERGKKIIEDALASYGVDAKVVQTNVGPAVTQYGIEPGWDIKTKQVKKKDRDGNITVSVEEVSRTRVKVERIASLANDLALALAAPSIKIEAPIPGKAMVGIEVPNPVASSVSLRSIIETHSFQKLQAKTKLPLALGKNVSGESVVADLSKMPHLLIAGATGSGKSVCMKSIIATFLMHATPDEVRMLMIDPKRVELVSFNNVPHLLSPVIIDVEKAVATLKWLAREMDHRYDRLAETGARDIESYNKNPRIDKPMSYLLLVVDELAELMMTAPDDVERILCRLAQLARATGIHLLVATQRPSVDVVTGLIKANFPARISFAVTSQVDSRTILDTVGAEKLLGQGDMLFLPPDAPKPRRLQGTFVSEAEIDRLVSFWISQRPSDMDVAQLDHEIATVSSDESREDVLVSKAKSLAREHSHLSTSFLQRRLGIGYPRAAKIMDILEAQGVVGPGEPGKSREVLKWDTDAEDELK